MARPDFLKTRPDFLKTLTSKLKSARGWLVDQAKDTWSWAKKHPILASMLVAGLVATATFPLLYALISTLPIIGSAVMSLVATAPQWSVPPIILALTVTAVAVQTALIIGVVSLFKQVFGGRSSVSDLHTNNDLAQDSDYGDSFEIVQLEDAKPQATVARSMSDYDLPANDQAHPLSASRVSTSPHSFYQAAYEGPRAMSHPQTHDDIPSTEDDADSTPLNFA